MKKSIVEIQHALEEMGKNTIENNHDHGLRDHEFNQVVYEEIMMQTDIIDFVNSHPVCKVAIRWGVYPQALTNAVKQYGPERVVASIRFTASYPAAKNKAAFFFSVLRNGIKKQTA